MIARRGAGEGQRVPDGAHGVARRAGQHDRVQADLGRERHAPVDGVDRPAGHALRDQLVEPFLGRLAGQLLGQQWPELIPVRGAAIVAGEPRVLGQFRGPDDLAQPGELGVVPGGHDKVPVPGGQRLVGEQAGMRIAHPERHHPASHPGAGLVDHPGQRRGQQVGLHVLPGAGGGPVVQGGHDAERGVQPGDHVEDRDPGPERRPVRVTGQAHQPGHGLHHEVIPGQVLAAARAEAADRGVDDARVRRADRLVVQPVAGQPAGLEVLHEHVRPPGQLLRGGQVGLVLQVQRDRALVPVDGQEVGGPALVVHRRHPLPGVVAARALHLDHVGTEVGQQHGAVRAGQHPGEVGDQQAGQRSRRCWGDRCWGDLCWGDRCWGGRRFGSPCSGNSGVEGRVWLGHRRWLNSLSLTVR